MVGVPLICPRPMCMIGLWTPDLEGSQLDRSERTEWNSKYSKIGVWFRWFKFGNRWSRNHQRGIYLREGLYLGVKGVVG